MELCELLQSEQGQSCFMEFLKKEYSQENLEFWVQCEQFKGITNKKQMKKCCEQLYRKFISISGSHSVNIDQQARKSVELNLKKPNSNMFDVAQNQIFLLMETDSFYRFLQSELFLKYQETLPVSNGSNKANSSRKRKRIAENIHKCSSHTYENDFSPKNAKLSDRSLNANISSLTKVDFKTSSKHYTGTDHTVNLENIECKNAFLFAESDLCDSESLYCNAPIYSLEISPKSSQHTRRPFVDPKWFNNKFIRIVFPDLSEEFLSISQKAPIRLLVDNLLHDKNFNFSSYQLFSIQLNEQIDLDQDISTIVFNDVRIEPRVTFMIHFPEGYHVNVETLTNKLPFFTIRSILSHFGINWQDIELFNQGKLLNENILMQTNFVLDRSNIYVNYLSSLRTYINLNDINDLNEDGIIIRDIQFNDFNRQKSSKANRSNLQTHPKSYNSFAVDQRTNNKTTTQMTPVPKNEDEHQYSNDPCDMKNIDLNDLSFSNENATDNFLTDIMTRDISKLNFICTPKKSAIKALSNQPNKQNLYENILYNNENKPIINSNPNNVKSPIHKARFVIIDDNEYENVLQSQPIEHPNLGVSSSRPLYVNQPFDQSHHCKEDILKLRNTNQNTLTNRRITQMRNQIDPIKSHSPISFTKYLLQPTTSPSHNSIQASVANNITTPAIRRTNRISLSANNNFANFCITPLKTNKPDLLVTSSSKKNRMRTLSRFHKII